MTRLWTAPGVVGVLAAVVSAWLARAVLVWLVPVVGQPPVLAATLSLVYAAGPAGLSAVPAALGARALLPRLGRSVGAYAVVGLLAGLLVATVQTLVLLSQWPWQLAGLSAWELVGIPVGAGLVGGVAAGLVARRARPHPPARTP